MVFIDKLFSVLHARNPLWRVGLLALNTYLILVTLSPPEVPWIATVRGQFQKGSPLYKQAIKKEKQHLYEKITTNPDVNYFFHPENALINNNGYIYDYPNPEQYRISMLIDPCRFQTDPGQQPTRSDGDI